MKDFWTRVREKCPKAYQAFVNYWFKKTSYGHPHECDLSHNNFRWLYDFFDSKGIYLCVKPVLDFENGGFVFSSTTSTSPGGVGIYIKDGDKGPLYFKTRTEAELASWERAFEILEKQLTA